MIADLGHLRIPSRRPPVPFGPQTVADVLDRGLTDTPDQEALIGPGGRLTYRELDVEANRAAHALLGLGVGPGDRVGASLPNDVDLVIAFLGAMRIGAVWVGVPRAFAAPEKRDLVTDCGVSVLLRSPGDDLDVEGLVEVAVDRADATAPWSRRTAEAPTHRPDVAIDPFAPAAISYTSGTTGRPKGVVHSQHNILMPGAVLVPKGSYRPEEPVGTILPLSSLNVMTLNAVIPFQAGSRSVLRDARGDLLDIATWVEEEGIAVFSLVPSVFQAFVDDPAIRPEMLRSVTKPRAGGTPVPEALVEAFHARFGSRICTSYGSTEILTTAAREDLDDPHVPGSVGRAMPHIRISIVDDDGNELGPDEVGEICVGPTDDGPLAGTYMPTLGYWGAPEATAEVLIDGRYRTGDIGRLDAEGNLYLVDRKKSLIIRNGSNIYPAEVERVLALDDRVAGSALMPRPDRRMGEATVAFVELRPDASATTEELRALCAEHLARYKVPDEIRFVDALPRNTMGKVDRPALSASIDVTPAP